MSQRAMVLSKQGFPYWGMGESCPTSQKFAFPPHLEILPVDSPLPDFYPPPLTKGKFPLTKSQFSCYDPIKISFLAVVIAPVPFLF